jgi:hypothetical protein
MYVDKGTCYSRDEFWAFIALMSYSHESIHVKWVADLNSKEEAQLVFVCGESSFGRCMIGSLLVEPCLQVF